MIRKNRFSINLIRGGKSRRWWMKPWQPQRSRVGGRRKTNRVMRRVGREKSSAYGVGWAALKEMDHREVRLARKQGVYTVSKAQISF